MAFLSERTSARPRSASGRAERKTLHGWRFPPTVSLALLCFLGVFPAPCPAQPAASASEYTEYQIKAAFLFNFARFVDWPADTFADSSSPITIGIFGKNPFGGTLEQIVAKGTVKGRPLRIVLFHHVREIRGCQILFISAAEKRAIPRILRKTRGSSMLTVGEIGGFAQKGGVINFVLRDNGAGRFVVRFEINVDAAERARLRISSKLLKLAYIVRDTDAG